MSNQSRFFLGNCMAHANIIVDRASAEGSRFFDDGTLAAESRAEYSIADRLAVVELMNGLHPTLAQVQS